MASFILCLYQKDVLVLFIYSYWNSRLQAVWLGGRTWLPRQQCCNVHLYMHSKRWATSQRQQYHPATHLLLLLQVTVEPFNDLSLLVHGGHKILDLLLQQEDVCHPTVTNLGGHGVYTMTRCESQHVRRMCGYRRTLWSMLHISTAANFHESVTAALTAVSKRHTVYVWYRRRGEWVIEEGENGS